MKNVIANIKNFLKKETVFSVAALMAIISMFFVHPSMKYLEYIDFRVLSILFCLMLLVAALREQWIFRRLAESLTKHISGSKLLELILVLLCFFGSMLITNDVALITFVPFALALLNGAGLKKDIFKVISLQTIGANLGSMLTPIGNPQNLYLYTLSGMSFGDFILLMLPLTVLSLIMLTVAVMLGKSQPITVSFDKADMPVNRLKLSVIVVLFVVCMGTVARFVPWMYSFAAVLLIGLIMFRNLFKEVDYYLLGTFTGFFIFIGNMQQIPLISNFIEKMLDGREFLVSALISQIISNVPAAMLLSGFTDNLKALIYGVNVGGLGTLIASLASLISYKFYAVSKDSQKGKYLLIFTMWNILFIAVLLPVGMLLLH